MPGFSLIELIVSLLLAVILGGIALKQLQFINQLHQQISGAYQREHTQRRVYILGQKIINDLNNHPLVIKPRIIDEAKENLLVENLTNFSNTPTLQQLATSQAISYFKLNFESKFRVEYDGAFLLTCKLKNIPAINQRFIGLSLKGINYYRGEWKKTNSGCWQFNLVPKEHLLLQGIPLTNAKFVHTLIPIKNEYLIYQDQNKTLRFLTLIGGEVMENQPIQDEVPALNFQLITNSPIWHLKISYLDLQSKFQEMFFYPSIKRQRHLHYTINQ